MFGGAGPGTGGYRCARQAPRRWATLLTLTDVLLCPADLEKLSFLALFRNVGSINRKKNEDHSEWQVGKPAFLKWEEIHTQVGRLSLAAFLSLGSLSTPGSE